MKVFPADILLVCGGRDYDDWDTLCRELDALQPLIVIHGAARGADRMTDRWARLRGVPRRPYPADWTRYGNAAGPLRNQQMLDEGHPTGVLAFPGGPGTADMVRRARAAGLPVRRVKRACTRAQAC